MEEVLECGECNKVFSKEETLKKHAKRVHNTSKIEKDSGLFSF